MKRFVEKYHKKDIYENTDGIGYIVAEPADYGICGYKIAEMISIVACHDFIDRQNKYQQ